MSRYRVDHTSVRAAEREQENRAWLDRQTAFPIRETQLRAELQLNKDEMRARREHFLQQGKHWEYIDKRVQYSIVGAQVLRGTREAVIPKKRAQEDSEAAHRPIALLMAKNPPPPRPVEFAGTLVVWHTPARNRKVVICYFPGADPYDPMNHVALRVRDNQNFLRGMKIPGEKAPGSKVKVNRVSDREDAFELAGPVPRWRGKW